MKITFRFFVYKFILSFAISSSVFVASSVEAGTFKEGYSYYTKGDFPKAEKSFLAATKNKNSSSENAQIYKFLGISQYMLGQRSSAQKSFQQAIQSSSSISIDPNEVLDESVVGFFNKIKLSKKAPPPKVIVNTRPPRRVEKKVAPTLIIVDSNVKSANVFQDGLLIGRVGQKLEAKSGATTLVIAASGHQTRQIRVQIFEGRENKLTANLSKTAPKQVAKKPKRQKKKKPKNSKPDSTNEQLFANEPSDPFAGRDLASEFSNDRSSKPASAPPGPQQVQQAAPAPSPAPQEAPPPQIQQAPQAPAIVTAPPIPQSQPSPQAQAAQIPAQQQVGRRLNNRRTVATQRGSNSMIRRTRAQDSSMSGGDIFVALLPFGAGQFQNRSYLLGSGFALGELGTLVYAYMAGQAAEKAIQNADEFNRRDDSEFSPEQKQGFTDETNKYVSGQKQEQMISLGVFAILWMTGSTEAFLNYESAAPVYRRPPPSRRRAYGVFHNIDQSIELLGQNDIEFERSLLFSDIMAYKKKTKYPKLSFDLMPLKNQLDLVPIAKIQWDF